MKDIELPPFQWGRDFPAWLEVRSDEEIQAEFTAYARAAIEADRAQRVPDGAISGALFDFAGFLTTLDAPVRFGSTEEAAPMVELLQEFAKKRGLSLDDADVMCWSDLLASTPAPAQQEPMEAFLVIDLSRELCVKPSILIRALQAQGIGNYSVNMALPKSAADAMRKHFKSAAQHQEQPQQERGPMTECQHHYVLDSEHVRHKCCQKCGDVRAE